MKCPRRQFLLLTTAAAVLPALPRFTCAQAWPSRYIRLVVPFAAGGGGDAIARPLAHRLSEVWGQQVVIENRGGAGGNVGATAVAQSPPDGYTILLGGGMNLATNPTLYPAGYNPAVDLAPVTMVTVIPNLMMVPNSSPARTVAEFIDYAKANRGKVSFASTGIGASPHLSGELFKRMAGIELTHVPYRGAGPAMERPDPRPRRRHVLEPAGRTAATQERHHSRHRRDVGDALARRPRHPGDRRNRARL
jgi:tripartite-type tricarboxylate transporter receptor subunit TctC